MADKPTPLGEQIQQARARQRAVRDGRRAKELAEFERVVERGPSWESQQALTYYANNTFPAGITLIASRLAAIEEAIRLKG